MIIFYSIDDKIFVEENHPSEKDPTSKENTGFTITITQPYVAMWLPFCPAGPKQTFFTSNTTGLDIPKEQWTPKMQSIAQDAKNGIKGTWKLWSMLIIFIAILSSFFILGNIMQAFRDKKTASQLELRLAPQPKDIVHLMYRDPETSWTAASAKISQINGDTIFIKISDQREPIIQFDHESAMKKLDTSDKMYDSQDEIPIVAKSFKDDTTKEGRIVFYNSSRSVNLPSCALKEIKRK